MFSRKAKPTSITIDLSTREGFAIASALRGPDSTNASHLKYALTGRIRFLATGIPNDFWGGYVVNPNPTNFHDAEVLSMEYEVCRLVKDGFNVTHYLSHIEDGADALMALFAPTLSLKSQSRYDEARELSRIARRLRGVAIRTEEQSS